MMVVVGAVELPAMVHDLNVNVIVIESRCRCSSSGSSSCCCVDVECLHFMDPAQQFCAVVTP